MKRVCREVWDVVRFTVVGLAICVVAVTAGWKAGELVYGPLFAQAKPDPVVVSPETIQQQQQLSQQVNALVGALRAEQEKTEALASSAANLRAQLQQTQQQLAPACVATVEKANPTKAIDPATFVITDKPAAPKLPEAAAPGRGGRR